ncbi:myosin light chain kinase, smooth muscle-like isoform X2 [Haliotis cracherodii]|uniref:myosin light chain kinase, smooth muscle-like isoform X2 n=1 Tax=Haliotis cracherodii TaxID=6455 RepID=UPI0039EA21CB
MYTCRVRGHPVPHVSWEKDGVAIKENSHFKISMQGDEHILEILNTNKTDAGNFTCRLNNSNGEVSNTAALVVKEKTDFRSVLKTRPTLGKLGKQNSTDSEKSDKENDLQFRHVLRKSDRSTPPGGYDDKRSRSGVQQVDFRNVLKHKTSKPDPVLASKSKTSEPARETVTLKSREAYKQNRDLNKSTTVKTETVSVRSVSKSKLYDSPKIEIDKFEKSSNVSLKKSPPQEDKALKSKLNKFEQMSNREDSSSGPFVKSQTKQGSLQGRLEKFEKNTLQDEVKTKVQTTPPTSKTPDKSVLGKLNKFEKLSSGEQTSAKKKTPPPTQTPKPRGNVLDKYSFKERTSPSHNLQNGKSNVKQEDLPTKNNTTEKSVKSRKEKFEASSDLASPEKTKQSKLDKSNKLENSPEQTWRSKQESEPLAVFTTRHSDIIQQPPRVRRQLADKRVRYGHQVVLECEISGGSVDWSVNGKAIRCSKFFKMAMTPENVATLMIAEAYSEDEGEYICTATNKFGTASTSCKLFVDASSSLSSRSDIEGAVTIPARLLTITPSSLAVTRGQKVIIEATFNGEPKPEVRWFKGRDEILKDKRIQLDSTGDHSVLTINKVTLEDAGRYMVAIENHAAKDSLCASVSIEDVPEPPGKPQANDILRTSVVLWWCGAPYDGGSQITHYKVQLKKVGDSNWTTLTSSCKNTFYQVDKLEEKTAYYFRVYAANKHGYSSSGEMSDKVFTSNRKISLDYESDDELPFEPREVKVEPSRKFEDEYEVMHEVGKGKFGNVYKCKSKESGKIWAAKILKCREKEKANIRHEIEIMNDLAHPKLMMIWDAFEAQRSMTLVMEFVGGGELFERVISDDFELTEGDCVHFMRQTCDGVGYMHNNGILHLDLKPENILCISDKTNQIKIIDFGLARRYEDGKSIKVLFGTPEFIAPEVINYDEISFATDMWSLGVICYLLLSGLSPFLGDNDAETLANVTRGEFDFDDESFDDITDNAKDFITRLMIKNKDKRYLIKQAEQHVWLAQDERRIRSKRLNTERLKRFMLRRKWQVCDDMDDIDAMIEKPNQPTTQDTHSSPREITQEVSGEERETTISDTPDLMQKKKTCPDHNGNVAISKQNGFNDSDNTTDCGASPSFIKEMLDCEAFTGDVIRFDVRVAGSPEPDFHWLHEEDEVQEDRRHIVDVSDNGQCSLIIRNVTEADEGEYSCIAVNDNGEASCSAELIICSIGAI